jgi:hypothetical protein
VNSTERDQIMLEQDHLLMNRLMKLIIKYDRTKDKEGFDEEVEPRRAKKPKNLVKLVINKI